MKDRRERRKAKGASSRSNTRRNLVFVRAGDASLHPGWIAGGGKRHFDLFVSYYGSSPQPSGGQCDFYEAVGGFKWSRLAEIFSARKEFFLNYDACWFPDDDLLADRKTINRMFELFHAEDLWLAQPALGPGSHLSHRLTAAVAGVRLRFTDFVEVMCPIINRQAMELLGPTFAESVSGWGLDFLWPHVLGYPKRRIAILDETPVVHTRPVKGGGLYQNLFRHGIDPTAEVQRIKENYGPFRGPNMKVFDTILPIQV